MSTIASAGLAEGVSVAVLVVLIFLVVAWRRWALQRAIDDAAAAAATAGVAASADSSDRKAGVAHSNPLHPPQP